MSIRFWVKACWMSCLLVFCLTGASFVMKLKVNVEEYPVPKKPNSGLSKKKRKQLADYSPIWESDINIKRKKIIYQPVKVHKAKNWFESLLKNNITYMEIKAHGYALIRLRYRRKPQLIESQETANKSDRIKRWILTLSGRQITVAKIVPGKGILFQINKESAWIYENSYNFRAKNKFAWRVKMRGSNSKGYNRIPRGDSNYKAISKKDIKDLRDNYDSYYTDLAPKLKTEYGNPVGIELRNISSKASKYGLRKNDIISRINGKKLRSDKISFLKRLLRRKKGERKKQVEIELIRNGRKVYLTYELR